MMRSDTRAAVAVAVAQFFFVTSWVVYTLYLKELLRRAGLDPGWFLWIVLLDQLIFAVTDAAMGFAADRVARVLGRVGPFLLAVNALACLLFAALPLVAGLEDLPGRGHLLLGLILVWVATSSVLRAPPLVLLTKHAARPRTPWLAALVLTGLALGGAAAPYLGQALKGVDPLLPFLVTGTVLFLATAPLVRLERRRLADTPPPAPTPAAPLERGAAVALLVGGLCLGFGFQVQAFFNAGPQYLRFTDAGSLVWLLPLFWVGFQLAVFPGAWAARRFGAGQVLGLAALAGGLALWGSARAPSLEALAGWQVLAGGAWGVVFMAGISTAVDLGRVGREGLITGLWFSCLALAALARFGLSAGGLTAGPQTPWLAQVPWAAWLLGAGPLLYLAARRGPVDAAPTAERT